MTRLVLLTFSGCLLSVTAGAEDKSPPRPNLIGITIESLADVGAPAWGLEEVLPDPEIRARVTPNLQRLAKMGATFSNAFSVRANPFLDLIHVTGKTLPMPPGYSLVRYPGSKREVAPHRSDSDKLAAGGSQSRWRKLIPTQRRDDDLSIEGWERLVESQPTQLTAAWAAKTIAEDRPDRRRLFFATHLKRSANPWIAAGVFFDRFPLDQIVLPTERAALRTLAMRMGMDAADPEQLAADPTTNLAWRAAIQAWLASASAADYAVGKIVDAIEAANTDDDPTNDWAVVCFASSPEWKTAEMAVQEIGNRADLLVLAPAIAKAGQRVTTPVAIDDLLPTLLAMCGDKRGGDQLLQRLEPAGDRYNLVAVSHAGGWFGVRSHRFRLVHGPAGEQEVYDLSKDPSGLIDLLDPENEASIEKFGLSPTQLESVRGWLGWKLVSDLDPARDRDAIESIKKAGVFEPPADFEPVMTGDFSRDGVVNAADKTLWQDALGEEVAYPGAGADANHDGRIDQEDDEIWRANYGRRAG